MTLNEAFIRETKTLSRLERRVFKKAVLDMTYILRGQEEIKRPQSSVLARQYAERYRVRYDTARRHLKEAGESLFLREVEYNPDGRKTPVRVRWIGRWSTSKEGNWIRFYWIPELYDALSFLGSKYLFEEQQRTFNLENRQ